MSGMSFHHLFVEASREADRLAHGVAPGQMSGRTPCGELDTRALVNHWVLYTSHGLEHRASRTPLPAELQATDFTADPDWADAYGARLRRAVDAWAAPKVWEGDVDMGDGTPFPAVEIASMVLKEMVVHGWDVARATGQEYRASRELAETVEKIVLRYAEPMRQYGGFDDPVVPAPDAGPLDRALAASGRDPNWKP